MQAEYDIISANARKAIEEMQIPDERTEGEKTPEKTEETPPTTADSAQPPETEGDSTTEATPFSVGDAEIERAVKAGLSVADARAFTDKGVFERVCAALEAKATPPDGGEKKISTDESGKKNGEGGDEDSFNFDVPELTEDEEFDPKLVKLGSVMKQMGDALKALREENKSLREQFGKSEEKAALDAAKEAEKAKKLEDRKALRIAQPGGVRGQRREKTDDDILAEVAGDIASKFNL